MNVSSQIFDACQIAYDDAAFLFREIYLPAAAICEPMVPVFKFAY